jgi:hypothetical protein
MEVGIFSQYVMWNKFFDSLMEHGHVVTAYLFNTPTVVCPYSEFIQEEGMYA